MCKKKQKTICRFFIRYLKLEQYVDYLKWKMNLIIYIMQGRIQRFWKGVALYVDYHDLPTKKILGFSWSKKTKKTLETTSFGQNIYISIFKFSLYLNTVKACQWNLVNFSKFANTLIRKEKKGLCSSQREKKNWEKLDFAL